MALQTWLIYFAALLVLTATPGPSVLMAVSISVNLGFRQAVLAALGSTSAIVGIMALSALGLGAVLAASELLFSLLKWAGAAYLAYLGLVSLLHAKRASLPLESQQPAHKRSFVRGFFVGASNPKALLFFTALFPQFIDPRLPQAPQFLLLCTTFVALELIFLLAYDAMGLRAKVWMQQPSRMVLFNRLTGGVFLLAAGLLASTKRSAA